MKRLTDKYEDYIKSFPEDYRGERKGYPFNSGIVLEKLGAYEDLEEQGLLVKLPCKTVYHIIDKGSKYATVMSKDIKNLTLYDIEGIDKKGYYFSTKEKAEKAMNECDKS